jgi:hypothetical protein
LFHACFDVPGPEEEHREVSELIASLMEELCSEPWPLTQTTAGKSPRRSRRNQSSWLAWLTALASNPWLLAVSLLLVLVTSIALLLLLAECVDNNVPTLPLATEAELVRRRRRTITQIRGPSHRPSDQARRSGSSNRHQSGHGAHAPRPSPLRNLVDLPPEGSARRRRVHPHPDSDQQVLQLQHPMPHDPSSGGGNDDDDDHDADELQHQQQESPHVAVSMDWGLRT